MSNRQRVLKRSNEADVEEVPASSSFFEFDDLIVVALKYCVFLVIEILAVATHGHLTTQSVKELDIFSEAFHIPVTFTSVNPYCREDEPKLRKLPYSRFRKERRNDVLSDPFPCFPKGTEMFP